jgi:hypothetical protein
MDDFDWKFYISIYKDLQEAGFDNKTNALNHWNNFGKDEDRICSRNNNKYKLFNWEKYINMHNDLKENGIDDKHKAFCHLMLHGIIEEREHSFIDHEENINNDFENINNDFENINNDFENINNDFENKENDSKNKNIKPENDYENEENNYENKNIKPENDCENEEYIINKIIDEDNFDWEYYILRYNDIKNNITNLNNINKHWVYNGKNENRFPNKLIEDEYNNFKWIKYIKGKNIDSKKDAFYDWFKGKDKIYSYFNWIFYKKYYELNNIDSENDAVKHYVKNYKKTPIINKNIYINYLIFNWDKYILYYNLDNINNKDDAFNYWTNTGKYLGHIFFELENKNNLTINIHKNIGIAISVYSSKETPKERILCSKICLNSIINKCKNTMIIIVIDGSINDDHYDFIIELTKDNDNVKIYKNINNFGISKTKNICLKILENYDYDYLCLLDDDIEVTNDFTNYLLDIFENIDIPILSNYNDEMPYKLIKNNNINFILTEYYYGNFLVINKKYLKKYGYMETFKYKWGEEHVEITKRYLKNSAYNNYAINLGDYIINEQIINGESTIHLHSMNIDYNQANINKIQMQHLLNNIKYVNFKFDINDIIDIKNNNGIVDSKIIEKNINNKILIKKKNNKNNKSKKE